MKSITPILSLAAVLVLAISCSRDDDQRTPINSNNRVNAADVSSLVDGITNISEVHTMNYKNSSSVMTYEYQASASPPALDYSQTSATSILRSGNLVYIGWHTHDPANYNGFAKYSGALTCYEVSAGTWTQVAQLEFDEMDIHEISLGGANELFIVGQSNPDASTYSTRWGHRGAIVGRVTLDANGHPITAGYIEKPLSSFGANSVAYVNASEIYVGTGNSGGYLYKMDNSLNVLDSVRLNNVKSVNRNEGSAKLGVLRGNQGRQNIMAKFYEWNEGAALPAESGGTDLSGITTFRFERNEGAYYNDIYLSSANQGLVEIDPLGPTVSTVYSDGLTIGVAADVVNEVIYVAAQNDGLKVLHGTGTANEYDLIGTFAPLSLNGGSWYVGDVVYDQNNVFMTSGSGHVIFTEIYPETYYLTINALTNQLVGNLNAVAASVPLSPDIYTAEIVSSTSRFGVTQTPWEGVFLYTNELDGINQVGDNYFTSLNGIGVQKTIDLSNNVGIVNILGFMTPNIPTHDDSGFTKVKLTRQSDNAVFYLDVDMVTNAVNGDISAISSDVSLPPGRYSLSITSSSVKFSPSQTVWEGAFLYTQEVNGPGQPAPQFMMTLNGIGTESIIDLSNMAGNTILQGYMIPDDLLANESGTVTIEIRELHN